VILGADYLSPALTLLGFSGSMLFGLGVGIWIASAKNKDLKQHGEAIAAINLRCDTQKKEIINDLADRICDKVKITINESIANLELQYKTAIGNTDRVVAVHGQQIKALEADVKEIFERINHAFDRRAKPQTDGDHGA